MGFGQSLINRAVVLALPLCVLASCGNSHQAAVDGGPPGQPTGEAGLPPINTPDNPRAVSLKVDEANLTGQVEEGVLRLQIPVTNLAAQASSGTLTVALQSVDGTTTRQTQKVPFQLDPSGQKTVVAEFPSPVSAQADWVLHNVLITCEQAKALKVTRSLLTVLGHYEVRLEGPSAVTRGRQATYRVRAQDPVTYQVLPGAPVQLVVRRGDEIILSKDGVTGDKGDAIFEVRVDSDGDLKVEAHARMQGTGVELSGAAQVKAPNNRVLLTTDKPIYQPGQTIYLRALALEGVARKPQAGQPAIFEIEDGKGNKIFKRTLTSDSYGLAATTFKLGSVLNLGTFKVRVSVGSDKAEKTVTVARYVLPKFKIDISADKAWYLPGARVSGVVDAQYFFGKALQDADVQITGAALDIGQTVFQKVIGRTDAQGRYAYAVDLPAQLVGLPINDGNATINLQVQVTDSAGQQVVQSKALTVASKSLRIAVVPEGTDLVPGLDNRIDVFVTDPLGSPAAEASLEVASGTTVLASGRTDAFGQFTFFLQPATATPQLTVTVTGKDGMSAQEGFSLSSQSGVPVLVRTDRAVYGIGDTVTIDVLTAKDQARAYLDWSNGGQTVDMRTLDVADGKASLKVTLDAGHRGSNRIDAYIVGKDGNMVRAGRTIFVRDQGALSVEMTTDKTQYEPGKPAHITFTVKDETGAPAVAALGVQVVDEAVFALVDAHPGLLRTYFELEQKFAQPSYQIRAPLVDINSLLFDETAAADPTSAAAAQARAAAVFAALGATGVSGLQLGSWKTVLTQATSSLQTYYAAAKQSLRPTVSLAAVAVFKQLQDEGCNLNASYCSSKSKTLSELFSSALVTRLQDRVFDFWGNAYRVQSSYNGVTLTSAGPDELSATQDDGGFSFTLTELDLSGLASDGGLPSLGGGGWSHTADAGAAWLPPVKEGVAATGGNGMTGAGGSTGSGPSTQTGTSTSTGTSDEPRVRQNFPETLYVNPQLITGADGKANISVDMADSITQWRVSSLAHSMSGKLGGGVGGIRVFQDFFVDIDFPATLTRGDEVSFPVAIYNYLDTPQTVRVELQAADWFTALGQTGQDVNLAAGQVLGVRFPVRVDKVGRQTMTVKGTGGTRADAVARSVLVVPDGQAVPTAISGSLGAGSETRSVNYPTQAVAGSQQLVLNVYPAYLSQVVDGMDSLLRVPNGCFEQTTSTAWPNVLVTAYMQQTKQLKPEVQLKAESLMSAGYQRLLTFEHKGGGYSWFGEQDGKPYLSVTAFGLMEFADMAKVHTVDEAMLARTRTWLVGQQAADGSWTGDRSEFFSFHTSALRNTAFVVWALASAGYAGPELARGLAFIKNNLTTEKLDAYSLGIVANAFQLAAPEDPTASQVLDMLLDLRKEKDDQVSWDSGGTQTCFYSAGNDADVAATALAAHALLLAGGHKDVVDKALAFLSGTRDSMGNFGSTQATIWTLRTLLLAASKGTEGAVGSLAVQVDGEEFTTVGLTADQADVMTTVDLSSLASTGNHDVTLTFVGTGKVSYNLVSQYNVPWASAPVPPSGPLSVSVSYDKTKLALDETATASVVVSNKTASVQNMIMVTLGLPPGFQVASEDLDSYKASKVLSSYEITGKQIILYLSTLAASGSQTITYRLQATMPVTASDGGAEAYLYYQPKQRCSAAAATLQVAEATTP